MCRQNEKKAEFDGGSTGSGSDYLSVHLSVHQSVRSGIVDVNTTSDRLIIEQLEHEITQKDREREGERQREGKRRTVHTKKDKNRR